MLVLTLRLCRSLRGMKTKWWIQTICSKTYPQYVACCNFVVCWCINSLCLCRLSSLCTVSLNVPKKCSVALTRTFISARRQTYIVTVEKENSVQWFCVILLIVNTGGFIFHVWVSHQPFCYWCMVLRQHTNISDNSLVYRLTQAECTANQ